MDRPIMTGGILLLLAAVGSAQVPLAGDTVVKFATAEEGRRILTARDDFIRALSPFDRAARMKTAGEVSEAEFLEFLGSSVLDWTESEKAAFASALDQLRGPLDRLALPWPKVIYAVKTTKAVEGGAPHTRDHALILPENVLTPNRPVSPRLLAHELFHILSRANPDLRDRLYAAIGFVKCGEVELPETLKNRRITNPDAPANRHCIRVQVAGEEVWAVPILYSRTEKYDVQQGGEFFRYLQFQLLLVDRGEDSAGAKPIYTSGQPRLVGVEGVDGFFEQVGRNTQYIIHPEEILADNFVSLLMQDPNVPSPEILKKMEHVLTAEPAQGAR